MSSQDTIKYAEAEEESAKTLRDEINREEAEIASLQKEAARDSSFQKDVDSRVQVVASWREKERRHEENAKRIRQQAAEERQQEQQEEERKKQLEKDSLAEMTKREAQREVKRSLFF